MKSLLQLLPSGWGLFQLGVEKVAAKFMGPGTVAPRRNPLPPTTQPYDPPDDDDDEDDEDEDEDGYGYDDDDEDDDDDDDDDAYED